MSGYPTKLLLSLLHSSVFLVMVLPEMSLQLKKTSCAKKSWEVLWHSGWQFWPQQVFLAVTLARRFDAMHWAARKMLLTLVTAVKDVIVFYAIDLPEVHLFMQCGFVAPKETFLWIYLAFPASA